MKRIVCLLGLVLLASLTAAAQDVPKAEGFLGYSYVRVNPGSGISGLNLNGGSGQFSYNVTNSISLVADLGGYRVHENIATSPSGPVIPLRGSVFSYLFGPRFTVRHDRVEPFAQVLFGGARASASALGTSGSDNGFAMAVGGGVDFKVNDFFAVRPVQAEYLLTRLGSSLGGTQSQHNFRYSAGVVFRFGKR